MSFLKHIGTKRHSGRYPWGSGKNPEQRGTSLLGTIKKLQKENLSEVEIANALGMKTSELRAKKTIAREELRKNMASQAQRLKDKNMSNIAIGKRMGINESSVRSLLDPVLQDRANITVSVANMLRDRVNKDGPLDVGAGVESHIGISSTKLNAALHLLEEEGYWIHYQKVTQLGTGKETTLKVLVPPGMTGKEAHSRKINSIVGSYSEDGGRSFLGLEPPTNINSARIKVRYGEEGGSEKDGVIELRKGVDDISLGNSRYAQVRISVDGTHYLKGMAIYSDNMPNGIDIIYNSNKPKGTPKEKVFKTLEDDPDNPFGSVVRQKHYIDSNGDKKLSALNIVYEEGKWNEWTRSISSQVLSKQSPALAKKQLDLARDIKLEEFEEISSLTNPVIKKALLKEFSDELDSAAVHLKAAALPRQANKVILPITSLKENEIYAPSYENGERVVLIRHPHGGPFEIPEVVVNNRNPEGKSILGNATDAIGIHPKAAQKLSGADFDGDYVLVIPNKNKLIKTAPALKELENFDPKTQYKLPDNAPKMTNRVKQQEMGNISNLITDMTIKGATASEIARAVKHSMVVIDAEKHHLDYKRSAIENGILELKKKYQGGERSGASTLISQSGSEIRINARTEGKLIVDPITKKTRRLYIDPETGKKLFTETKKTFIKYPIKKENVIDQETGKPLRDPYTNKLVKQKVIDPITRKPVYDLSKGKEIRRTEITTRMAKEEDAFNLSSGTKIESVYAEYANTLKALANRARKLIVETPNLVQSSTASITYAKEVARLKAALAIANRNKPLERQAQLLANSIVKAKKDANPDMSQEDLKKIKGQALNEARHRIGAKKEKIVISDKEWEAIQLGAISNNVLSQIIANADSDAIKAKATPRTAYKMTDAKIAKAKAMLQEGYTTSEIASALGVSTTTIQESIK